MTETLNQVPAFAAGSYDEPDQILRAWVGAFDAAAKSRDAGATSELFQADATFRDLLALAWDFRNAVGREDIGALITGADSTPPVSIEVRPGARVFTSPDDAAWTFLRFRTEAGGGDGYVRLVRDVDDVWRASALVLRLGDLDSSPERIGDKRIDGRVHGPVLDRVGWQDSLDHDFESSEPTVVILGAGHCGLALAARLRALGVPALIIETNDRVGDNWRKRYTSLALHTPIAADELPYLPYPQTWTRFTPKDKLADFLESYAILLDLAVWTGSRAENVHYNEDAQRWSLDVTRPDGSRRRLTPEHLVLATGNNAEPIRPQLPGQEDYAGTVIHAVDYRGWRKWAGKNVVVVGTGVSGHDLAQDLAEHGAKVTLVQRSPTVIMNISTVHATLYANHTSGNYTTDESDLIGASTPLSELPSRGPGQVAAAKELDHELLKGLAHAGFQLSDGPDGQGVLGLIYGGRVLTGYYYNAGCSQLIIDGTVGLRHGSVTGFGHTGVLLDNGDAIEADLVVFATGYRGVETAVRNVLGEELGRELAEVADIGDDGEFGRLWRRSGRDRLWFMYAVSLTDGRFYSKLLALQIAAIEAGTIPAGG